MKNKKEKSAAILKIIDASKMTLKGRRSIISWLKRQTRFFERHPDKMADRCTARYLYV